MKFILVLTLLVSFDSFAKEIKINVQGMICSMCAQGAKKKFVIMSGVKEANFLLGDKAKGIPPSIVLTTKDDQDVDDDTIKKTIQEAGYNVKSIERK